MRLIFGYVCFLFAAASLALIALDFGARYTGMLDSAAAGEEPALDGSPVLGFVPHAVVPIVLVGLGVLFVIWNRRAIARHAATSLPDVDIGDPGV